MCEAKDEKRDDNGQLALPDGDASRGNIPNETPANREAGIDARGNRISTSG